MSSSTAQLAASGMLRLHGWPAPEDPPDDKPSGDTIADRLNDEAQALRDVSDRLDKLVRTGFPEVLNLRPRADHPLDYRVVANHDRTLHILGRIAADIDELARARRVEDLPTETVDADPRLRLRRRLAEPPDRDPPARLVGRTRRVRRSNGSRTNTAGRAFPCRGRERRR